MMNMDIIEGGGNDCLGVVRFRYSFIYLSLYLALYPVSVLAELRSVCSFP